MLKYINVLLFTSLSLSLFFPLSFSEGIKLYFTTLKRFEIIEKTCEEREEGKFLVLFSPYKDNLPILP